MPASIPFEQEERKTPIFTAPQIAQLMAFVMSRSRGDKSLPQPQVMSAPDSGVLKNGRAVYAENCEHCHAATGHGDAVGYQDVAPELMDSTPIEIAEAVRMGPDVMPRFGAKIIDDRSLNDLIAYVQFLQRGQYNPGGLQLANWGPVPEGFFAWVAGLGLLVLLVRRIGSTE
jgi:ubiquinol-cytochrome c reductase cytochrome c subunit